MGIYCYDTYILMSLSYVLYNFITQKPELIITNYQQSGFRQS